MNRKGETHLEDCTRDAIRKDASREDTELYATRVSHRKASRELVQTRCALGAFGIFLLLGFVLGAWSFIQLCDRNLKDAAELAELASYCLLVSTLAGVFPAAFPYFSEKIVRATKRSSVGKLARYSCSSGEPPVDSEKEDWERGLYDKYYKCESGTDKDNHFLVAGLPIYFLIPPTRGLKVAVHRCNGLFCDRDLVRLAAELGLDWSAFRKWRESEQQKLHYGRRNEESFRLCRVDKENSHTIELYGDKCTWRDFECTESVVNLTGHDLLPDMRQLFEAKEWPNAMIRLQDIGNAGQRYSMLMGTCTLVTSNEGYLVLARRSKRVSHEIGVITSTANGGVQFSDVFPEGSYCGNLRAAALRELEEEIGITEDDILPDDTPFLGAGFDLAHGRDLNFYAHFKSKLSFKKISERKPDACDSWETDYLIPVPPQFVAMDGTLLGCFKRFERVELDRQLRAALYCLAKSGRLTQS